MFDLVIVIKDGDFNEKGVSWHARNALAYWFVSFKFDDLLLLFDPSFVTKDDQNDLDDWSDNKQEELDDVKFAGNNDDKPIFCNHTFFWFIIPQIDPTGSGDISLQPLARGWCVFEDISVFIIVLIINKEMLCSFLGISFEQVVKE